MTFFEMFFCNPRETCIQLQHHRMLTRELFQKEWIQSWAIWEDLGFSIPAIMLDDQNLFSLFIYTHLFLSALLCFGINEYSPFLYQPPVEMLPHFTLQLITEMSEFAFFHETLFQQSRASMHFRHRNVQFMTHFNFLLWSWRSLSNCKRFPN